MPVFSSAKHAVFIFPRAPGRSLSERFISENRIDISAVAAFMRRIQHIETPDFLREHDYDAERVATLRMLDRSRAIIPELDVLRQAVAEIGLPSPGPVGFSHRDLHDKQVFIHKGAVHIIDFEGAVAGPQLLDSANLFEHFRLRQLQGRTSGDERAGRMLLDKLEIDPCDREFGVLTALTRARLAGVYAIRPPWRDLSLTLARSALEQLREAS
jgi:aminoglycoside phosphotransferase (APT) family kinase protein